MLVGRGSRMKDFFAALLKSVAATFPDAPEQCLHLLEPLDSFLELSGFSLSEFVPPFRWRRPGREPEEQLAYFLQGESCLPGALHDGETKKCAVVITALTILAHGLRENADLLVVTNRGCAQTKHACDIGDREEVFGHAEI